MRSFSTIIQTTFTIALIAVVLLLTLPFVPYDFGLELRIVESGSMEPAIPTGALVAIYPAASYVVGDIITFKSAFGEVPTTHRVMDAYMENGQTWFITKGDANEEADTAAVPLQEVLGKVQISVPYVGFVLDFARQPLGFMLLIVLPALAIIIGELEKIWKEVRRRRAAEDVAVAGETLPRFSPTFTAPVAKAPAATSRSPRRFGSAMMDIKTPVRYRMLPTLDLRGVTPRPTAGAPALSLRRNWFGFISVLLIAAAIAGAGLIGTTISYVVDGESSLDNRLMTVSLDVLVTADNTAFVHEGEFDDDAVSILVSPEADSVDMWFTLSAEMTGGTEAFCDTIDAASTDPFVYNGALIDLTASDVEFSAPWELAFSLSSEAGLSNGMTCTIDLIFTAWHIDELTEEGYFDEERLSLNFTYVEEVVELLQIETFTAQSLSAPADEAPEGEFEDTENEEKSEEPEAVEKKQSEPEPTETEDPIDPEEEQMEPEEEQEDIESEEETDDADGDTDESDEEESEQIEETVVQ